MLSCLLDTLVHETTQPLISMLQSFVTACSAGFIAVRYTPELHSTVAKRAYCMPWMVWMLL